VREAARLDSFIQALTRTAGNQVDMAEGGAEGVADRARNERLTGIVDKERLTRMQGLLRDNGITMTKRQIAMDQNGDLSLNLTPESAAQMWRAGLINESQLGAVANGGHARFSFAHNDLLVSSSAGFEKSARADTSTRFEAGKQAGPDTVEHFLSGGKEGHDMMANWLRGGFEMDRKGDWRLKPQVADTLQRDIQAVMAQTGWSRSLDRTSQDQLSQGTDIGIGVSAAASGSGGDRTASGKSARSTGGRGLVAGNVGLQSSDRGVTSETATASINIVNYDVRESLAASERSAARSSNPEKSFVDELSKQVFGSEGLRNRYLSDADAGRGTVDITGPITSIEQNALLDRGRFSTDIGGSLADGNSDFKR